jgi:hypothetical protein
LLAGALGEFLSRPYIEDFGRAVRLLLAVLLIDVVLLILYALHMNSSGCYAPSVLNVYFYGRHMVLSTKIGTRDASWERLKLDMVEAEIQRCIFVIGRKEQNSGPPRKTDGAPLR